MNFPSVIGRFLSGGGFGLFIALICWSYSVFFSAPISLMQGILGSIVLAMACGTVASLGNAS